MGKAGTFLYLILAVSGAQQAFAQDAGSTNQANSTVAGSSHDGPANSSGRYYKLVFRVIAAGEDGAPSSTRVYSQVVSVSDKSARRPSEIRTGDKVALASSSPTADNVSTQFQYIEIGTEIDTANVTDDDGAMQASVTARVSSLGKPNNIQDSLSSHPVIRECKWDSRVTVQIGKPTIIFSSDNPSDKGKTELELTATPIH